jgi:hypothetical protein
MTVQCPTCPMCDQPPLMVMGGTQAFCGNTKCRVLTWNPAKGREELLANEVSAEWKKVAEDGQGTDHPTAR